MTLLKLIKSNTGKIELFKAIKDHIKERELVAELNTYIKIRNHYNKEMGTLILLDKEIKEFVNKILRSCAERNNDRQQYTRRIV